MTHYYPEAYNDYIYTFTYDGEAFAREIDRLMPFILQIGAIVALLSAVVYLVLYVFESLSIYTMAERRGLTAAFTAWIPVVRWSVLGRIASDVHRLRTKKRAFYGFSLLLLNLAPICAGVYGLLGGTETVVGVLAALAIAVKTFVMPFALSEVYREYSRHWVGMLIFTIMMPILRPVFLLAIHKHVPVSVRMAHANAAPAPEPEPQPEPAAPAPEPAPEAAAETEAEAAPAEEILPEEAPAEDENTVGV